MFKLFTKKNTISKVEEKQLDMSNIPEHIAIIMDGI